MGEYHSSTGKTFLLADVGEGTRVVNIVDVPVPVKLLMHPMRPGHGGPLFDTESFHEAVNEAAERSKKWGHRTAIKSMAASFPRSRLNPNGYATVNARSALLKDLVRRWDNKPICASVAIEVWQLYFKIIG